MQSLEGCFSAQLIQWHSISLTYRMKNTNNWLITTYTVYSSDIACMGGLKLKIGKYTPKLHSV